MDRSLSRLIERLLDRIAGFQVRDMYTILNLGGGYTVSRVEVDPDSWLAGETLRSLNLPAEGLIVLAVERPDSSVDYAPGAEDCVPAGGCLIVYGPQDRIAHLCERLSADPGTAPVQPAVDGQQ